MNRCEWNPARNAPSTDPPSEGDCPNEATVSVGRADTYHLCESCAALPRFARRKVRQALKRTSS